MDGRIGTHKAILPTLSGPALSGALGALATILLAAAVFTPLLATAPTLPEAREIAHRVPAPEPPAEAKMIGPELPTPVEPVATRNLAPRIERVAWRSPVTGSGDLRLKIHASDPDGDPVVLRTSWILDGRELETEAPVLPKSHLRRGDTIFARVVASSHGQESTPFVTEAIRVENAPPLITTFPTGFEPAGDFVYRIAAVDPDGDQGLEYRLVEGPDGMTIEPHEGVLRWQPSSAQAGRHEVRVEVRDGRGGVQHQLFDLVVPRRRPVASELAEHASVP